jgi:hypothetical protein
MAEHLHALVLQCTKDSLILDNGMICGDEAAISYSIYQMILNQKISLGEIYPVMSHTVFLNIIHCQTYVPLVHHLIYLTWHCMTITDPLTKKDPNKEDISESTNTTV